MFLKKKQQMFSSIYRLLAYNGHKSNKLFPTYGCPRYAYDIFKEALGFSVKNVFFKFKFPY